jgi:hypothetical protein
MPFEFDASRNSPRKFLLPRKARWWKDCETFDESKDLADRSGESYFWTYVYDDSRELLYEAGSYQEHAESLR